MPAPTPNPYAPPTAPPAKPAIVGVSTCPQCRGTDVYQPAFTWWGGALGPKLFKHMVCRQCRFGYSARTGKSNTGPIVAYQAITMLVALGAAYFLWMR